MRLWGSVPLSVLSVIPLVLGAQLSWVAEPSTQSRTLVEALNDDEDYSLLLGLLQRAKLIPTLNRLNGSTFFAPTNDAIKRYSSSHPLWRDLLADDSLFFDDNLHEKLRQDLFYHLLNYSLLALPTDANLSVEHTLLYPKADTSPPINQPPPGPPWMPIPEGLLGNVSQRLRVTSREGEVWAGVDAFGNGGVQIIKGQVDAGNGVLLGVADVLEIPPDLKTVVTQQPSLSYLQKILTPDISKLLNSTPELTLFLPVDSAWQSLDSLERTYLESEFAFDDLYRILQMHAVLKTGVKWSDSFEPALNLTTADGTDLKIVVSPEKTMVSDATLVQPDIYASNGVLHLVSDLLIPPGAFRLTPEKYLLALNCTSFVSLLHSVNLTSLINDTKAEYTILAPKDDVLAMYGGNRIPEKGREELRRWLQYHFIPGRWTPKKLKDGMLLGTALQNAGLAGDRQVLSVEVSDSGKQSVASKNIKFGGAGVIGEHLELNNSIVYFVSHPLDPPSDPLQTALPLLDLSSFLAAIFSTDSLADLIKKRPRSTLLIPHNSAFKRLGLLVSDYLLAASSKPDLERVILHHVIDGVQYSQSLVNGSQRTFATLEGSDLQFERPGNGSVVISASGGWAGMKGALYPKNMLTETGVIHEMSDILIPRSVELNVGKLMRAAKATTMNTMVVKAGFDWVLNGTAPPEGSPWANQGLGGTGWTLLCPTDDAFKKFNLTKLYEDIDVLRFIISQHLIPTPPQGSSGSFNVMDVFNNNRPLPMEKLGTHATLLSPSSNYGDIVFRELDDKSAAGYMVGIKGARGTDGKQDWARVLSWGRSTTWSGTGGVILIDQLLVPYQPSWLYEYGGPIMVTIVGMGLICLFFYGVRIVWSRDTTEATYEPVGGFGRDDDS